MPDLIHILLYSSVRCELAGACHIQDGALRPVVLVAVSSFHSLLCFCIGLEVLEDEVGVCLGGALGIQQRVVQRTEQLGISRCEGSVDQLHQYLADILIIVVRYFGGIKLGTSGLIVAYRTAAAQAIAEATIIEKTVDQDVKIVFEYPFMNDVMRIVKEEAPEILEQSYDMDCIMRLRIRKSLMPRLHARLEKVETLRFPDEDVTAL